MEEARYRESRLVQIAGQSCHLPVSRTAGWEWPCHAEQAGQTDRPIDSDSQHSSSEIKGDGCGSIRYQREGGSLLAEAQTGNEAAPEGIGKDRQGFYRLELIFRHFDLSRILERWKCCRFGGIFIIDPGTLAAHHLEFLPFDGVYPERSRRAQGMLFLAFHHPRLVSVRAIRLLRLLAVPCSLPFAPAQHPLRLPKSRRIA